MTPAAKATMIDEMVEHARVCARAADRAERALDYDTAYTWRAAQSMWLDRINTFTLLAEDTSND